jgi:hypothetical protein
LTTVSINDTSIRAVTCKGKTVERWAEVEIEPGLVADGTIEKPAEFRVKLGQALQSARAGKNSPMGNMAVSFSGRNLVQRSLLVSCGPGEPIEDAITAACSEGLGVPLDELALDWFYTAVDGQIPALSRWTRRPRRDTARKASDYDVYVLGLQKNMVRSNLRALSGPGATFHSVQPKALAIAAAVDASEGVIVDIEATRVLVLVLRGGLPEVIREVSVEPDLSGDGFSLFVRGQVSKAVAFFNGLFPEVSVDDETPLFVTGMHSRLLEGASALGKLPYNFSYMPQLVRAPRGFPQELFAANIGLSLLAGGRFRLPGVSITHNARPRFEFLPDHYRARPGRARAAVAAAGVTAMAASSTVLFLAGQSAGARADRLATRVVADEREVRLRRQAIADYLAALKAAESAKTDALAIQGATDSIKSIDRGISQTLKTVAGLVPEDVVITDIEDDGKSAKITAASSAQEDLFAFARLLDGEPAFQDIVVRSMFEVGGTAGTGTSPQAASGVPSSPEYRMQLEIIRPPLAVN